jgi:hypothetical protein
MGGAGRDGHAITVLENPPRVADEHLEATTEYTERLIGSVVDMGWRLVAGVVLQVPSPDHEVIHTDNLVLESRLGFQHVAGRAGAVPTAARPGVPIRSLFSVALLRLPEGCESLRQRGDHDGGGQQVDEDEGHRRRGVESGYEVGDERQHHERAGGTHEG